MKLKEAAGYAVDVVLMRVPQRFHENASYGAQHCCPHYGAVPVHLLSQGAPILLGGACTYLAYGDFASGAAFGSLVGNLGTLAGGLSALMPGPLLWHRLRNSGMNMRKSGRWVRRMQVSFYAATALATTAIVGLPQPKAPQDLPSNSAALASQAP